MPLYLTFPQWLAPEMIPGLPFRWYGLMYILAFALTIYLFWRQAKKAKLGIDSDSMISFFLAGILGLLLGARIVYMLVYALPSFLANPLTMVWPFDSQGQFVGFQGMSFHGGLVGLVAGFLIYARAKRIDMLQWGDLVAAAAPLGYTFGRLGNFINGELWGRVTDSPLGMVFPRAEPIDTSQPWAAAIAKAAGIDPSGMANLPRHPSQLYEAIFEGLVLWAILWFIVRKRKPFEGWVIGWYMIGYGVIRFVIEYFREPDRDLGYIITLQPTELPAAAFSSALNFSMGQILCFLMVVAGAVFLALRSRSAKAALAGTGTAPGVGAPNEEDRVPDPVTRERKAKERRLRNKLK